MRNYLRNEHWKTVPWLIGLLLLVDVVARQRVDVGELLISAVGLFALCAACIGLDVFLGQFRA